MSKHVTTRATIKISTTTTLAAFGPFVVSTEVKMKEGKSDEENNVIPRVWHDPVFSKSRSKGNGQIIFYTVVKYNRTYEYLYVVGTSIA